MAIDTLKRAALDQIYTITTALQNFENNLIRHLWSWSILPPLLQAPYSRSGRLSLKMLQLPPQELMIPISVSGSHQTPRRLRRVEVYAHLPPIEDPLVLALSLHPRPREVLGVAVLVRPSAFRGAFAVVGSDSGCEVGLEERAYAGVRLELARLLHDLGERGRRGIHRVVPLRLHLPH